MVEYIKKLDIEFMGEPVYCSMCGEPNKGGYCNNNLFMYNCIDVNNDEYVLCELCVDNEYKYFDGMQNCINDIENNLYGDYIEESLNQELLKIHKNFINVLNHHLDFLKIYYHQTKKALNIFNLLGFNIDINIINAVLNNDVFYTIYTYLYKIDLKNIQHEEDIDINFINDVIASYKNDYLHKYYKNNLSDENYKILLDCYNSENI
jgi:hypothetical protein